MNTLRVKIALLMVVAIVTVVGLLTVVLFYLLGPPQRLHSLGPVAQQIETLVRVVDEGSHVIAIVPEPAPGRRQQTADREAARFARTRAASILPSRCRATAGARRSSCRSRSGGMAGC